MSRSFPVLLLGLTLAACSHTAPSLPARATVPLAAVPAGALRFAVIGDFGDDGPAETRVAALVHSWDPAFIVTVGDNNYSRGTADTIEANIGKHYHRYIRFDPHYVGPYKGLGSAEQRFFATLGNHDWKSGSVEAHTQYFDLPGNERYYSVRKGPVEIFAVDSDAKEPDGNDAASVQAAWLKAALAASDAPWKLVVLHHAPYSTGHHGPKEIMQWPYEAWGASAVLAGHDHHYERILRGGFPYWVVGTGGADLRTDRKPMDPSAHSEIFYPHKHGALVVTAQPQWVELSFYTVDAELIDTYRIDITTTQPTRPAGQFAANAGAPALDNTY